MIKPNTLRISLLIILLNIFLNLTGIFVGLGVAFAKPTSTYLNIQNCVELSSEPEQEGAWKGECPSLGGIRIFKELIDARQWLSFQRPRDSKATPIAQNGTRRSGFPYLTNHTLEIRYDIKKEQLIPIGVIYRVSGSDLAGDTSSNQAVQTLIVVSFEGKKIRVVDEIDGALPNANEIARKTLDLATLIK